MKQKLLLAIFALLLLVKNVGAQGTTGYIYIHNKSINEANSTSFVGHITGGTTTVPAFTLNDKPDFIHVGDIGAGNGSGRTEMWAISSATSTLNVTATGITGNVYHRSTSSAAWNVIPTTGSASAVDGAGLNSCVYVSGTNVYYYNGATTFEIFVGGTGSFNNATDVSYANGITAIVSSNGNLYYFNGSYTANNTTSNTGWNVFNAGNTNANARIDLNWTGTTLAYITASATSIKTIPVNTTTGPTARNITVNAALSYVNGSTGSTVSGAATNDIAYDSAGVIYTIANVQYVPCSGTGTTGIVFRYSPGDANFTEEGEGRGIVRLTGGAGGEAWGTASVGFADAIWARATDNLGAHVWLDDERVRTNLPNGNSIMIAVAAGTYTYTEDLPSTSYDLGRFNIYDPTGNTVGTPSANSATIDVAAGETVNIEVINEFLVPKSIDLSCTLQILQTFGTGTTALSTEFGNPVEGTAYHYANSTSVQDGYYFLVHDLVPGTNWFTYTNSYTISDHTVGDVNGYFMVVNASYAKDEFYRQRVTNLVPGLQYTISFYLANVLNCNPIKPNINYGLQDLTGNIIDSASTGDISTNGTWTLASFTFTATASTADLYLRNNNIGGLGNDVALDDISLNPVLTTLGANQISPIVAPNLCIGTSYTFSNTPSGGTWTSSNPSIASINPASGIAITKTGGTVIVTYSYVNQVGCTSDTTRELFVTAAPTATSTDLLGKTSCLNQTDSLYASATGTAAPFTYLWTASPSTGAGLTNPTAQNTAAHPTASGTYIYTMTATDQVGCTTSINDTLVVSTNTAPTVTLNTLGADCVGGTGNYTLTSSQSGGTGSYHWAWSGSPTGNGIVNVDATTTTASPTAAGTYAYTVKVSDGFCTVPVSTSTSAFASPSLTVSPTTGSSITLCSNGKLALAANPSGGSGTYTYSWSGSPAGNGLSGTPTTQTTTATPTATNTSPGYTYTVNITDGNGCKATGSTTVKVTIGLFGGPTVTVTSPTAQAICAGGSVNLTATVSPALGVYTYTWTGPATIANASLASTTATPATSGVYQVTVLDVTSLCSTTANSGAVTVNPVPTLAAVAFADDICTNTKDTVSSTVTGGTAPYTYQWTVSPTPGSTLVTPTASFSPISVATFGKTYTYTMTVTDSKSCTATGSRAVRALDQTGPAVTNMATANDKCLNSSFSFSPTVTPGGSVTTLTGTVSSSGSNGSHNSGLANDGNTGTYWESDDATGGYIYMNFTSGPQVVTSLTIYPVSGNASDFNGARVDVSSASNFSSFNTIYTIPSTPSSGTYTTYTFSNVLSRAYARIYFPSARGDVAEFSFGAGTTIPISTYAWTASGTGNGLGATTTQNTTATPTVAGSYTYTLKAVDASGCAASASTAVQTADPNPNANPLASNPAFCGGTGSINLFGNPSDGTTPYSSFAWTATRTVGATGTISFDDATSQDPVASVGGSPVTGTKFTFTIIVTDANSCADTATTSAIVVSSTPTATASAALAATACVGQNINLTGTITGTTTGPYTYAWTPSSNSTVTPASTTTSATTNTPTASTTSAGNYTFGLAVFDNNNCSGTANTAIIAITDTPHVSVTTTGTVPAVICTSPTSTIHLSGSVTTGTTSPYTYSWSGSGVVNANATTTTAVPTTSTAYGFTATDAKGCTGTAYTAVLPVDQATPTISVASCGINSNGVAYVQLYESNGNNSWLWSNVSGGGRFYTSSALSPLTDSSTSKLQSPYIQIKGIYQVVIKDANNCTGTGTIDATIALGGCTILNVKISSFTAQKEKGSVLLNWVTAGEINNDHFDVLRSTDGVNWQAIGTVKGHGTTNNVENYSFTDNVPFNGVNYYRLKQVDFDGRFMYSDVRTIQFTSSWLVRLYPNPASDFVILEFNSDKEEKGYITIQTALGSTIFAKEQALVKGFNRIKLNEVQPLAQGTYMITMATTSNVFRSKFVKGEK